MQGANDGASELEYKPFGLVRFVCGSSVLLLLLRVRAVDQQTLAVFVYRRPRRLGIMMRASPGDRGRGGEMGLLARRARFVWLALLVVVVALPGAAVAQNAPAASGDKSSFGSQLRNLK